METQSQICFSSLPVSWREEEARARTRLAEAAVSRACCVPVEELRARTRRKAPVAFARQMAMYLSHVALGVSLTRIGTCFGRDRTTASHACRVIEDRRDDPAFDHLVGCLEESLSDMAESLEGRAVVEGGLEEGRGL